VLAGESTSDGLRAVSPISSFSGGERYRVHIALRIGLAAMLAAGSGIPAAQWWCGVASAHRGAIAPLDSC
jgi:hypothetical protein